MALTRRDLLLQTSAAIAAGTLVKAASAAPIPCLGCRTYQASSLVFDGHIVGQLVTKTPPQSGTTLEAVVWTKELLEAQFRPMNAEWPLGDQKEFYAPLVISVQYFKFEGNQLIKNYCLKAEFEWTQGIVNYGAGVEQYTTSVSIL